MSATLPRILTEDDFDELVATAPGPFLVDVGATWCGPCQRLTPVIEAFAADNADRLPVHTLDADDPRPLSWRLGAGTLPRMLLIDRGAIQLEVPGYRDRAFLDDTFGTYPDLSIDEPDGRRILPRTPARRITLSAPAEGTVAVFVIPGDTNELKPEQVMAPFDVEVPAGSYVRLMVQGAAASLDELAPDAVEAVYAQGLGPADIQHVARLTGLRSLFAPDATVTPDDLGPLIALPLLGDLQVWDADRRLITAANGRPDFMIAASVAAARAAAGLPPLVPSPEPDSPVDVTGKMKRQDDGSIAATVMLKIADGWYAYPEGSDEGVPLAIDVAGGHRAAGPWHLAEEAAHLEGRVELTTTIEGGGDDVRLTVTTQACNGDTCLMPSTVTLAVPVT